jgi:hypothetical protein
MENETRIKMKIETRIKKNDTRIGGDTKRQDEKR